MSVALAKQKQGLLFSEPSFAETGVWCQLADGIDPAKWARICRHIGSLNFAEFQRISAMLIPEPKMANSDIKRKNKTELPLVSIGPGKPSDRYQWEI